MSKRRSSIRALGSCLMTNHRIRPDTYAMRSAVTTRNESWITSGQCRPHPIIVSLTGNLNPNFPDAVSAVRDAYGARRDIHMHLALVVRTVNSSGMAGQGVGSPR
jgi:hypothetical protein